MSIESRSAKRIEAVHGRTLESILRELYEDEGLSQVAVGERLGVSRWLVIEWMAELRIPTRDRRKVA